MLERPESFDPEDFTRKRAIDPADVLDAEQIKKMRTWLAERLPGNSPEIVATADQLSAEIREGLEAMGIDIEDPKTYYVAFATLGMIESYLDVAKNAGKSHEAMMKAVDMGLANLAPEALRQRPDTQEE